MFIKLTCGRRDFFERPSPILFISLAQTLGVAKQDPAEWGEATFEEADR